MVMAHIQTQTQVQILVGSEDRVKTSGRTTSASYPLWTGNEYRPKRGDALRLGAKAGWFIPFVDKRVGGR